jgi:hypothetical protein
MTDRLKMFREQKADWFFVVMPVALTPPLRGIGDTELRETK